MKPARPVFVVLSNQGDVLGASDNLLEAYDHSQRILGEGRVMVDATTDLEAANAAMSILAQNGQERAENPSAISGFQKMPQRALTMARLDGGAFNRWASPHAEMSLEEAHEIAKPYFAPIVSALVWRPFMRGVPTIAKAAQAIQGGRPDVAMVYDEKKKRVEKRVTVSECFPDESHPSWYNNVDDLADHFFGGGNSKLQKGAGISYYIAGLSLLPANVLIGRGYARMWVDRVKHARPATGRRAERHEEVRGILDDPKAASTTTWCVGSTEACRSVCLVDAGQSNVSDLFTMAANNMMSYQRMLKVAFSTLLLNEPEAFARLLAHAMGRFADRKHKDMIEKTGTSAASSKNFIAAVRLNVFQDLPWELLCPELMQSVRGKMMCYDYTKVAGRDTSTVPYHLTFSYAGDNDNAVAYELAQGRNIAVVFLPYQIERKKGRTGEERIEETRRTGRVESMAIPLNWTFRGKSYPVINGKADDARFLDPNGPFHPQRGTVVVGLVYLPPR